MAELKQANFRINPETANAFRAFCKENGMDQAQGFDHIMQVIELNKAKVANLNRLTEIEEFERLAKSLITAYLNSLEIANTTEERVREQFQTNLKSKDELIIKLQEDLKIKSDNLKKAEEEKKEAKEIAKRAEIEAIEAKEREEAANKSIQDKESINNTLQSKLTEAENKITGYNELKESVAKLQTELDKANQTIKDNRKDAELAQLKAISEIKEEMQRKITEAEKLATEVKANAEKEIITINANKDTEIARIKLEQTSASAKQAEKYQQKIDDMQKNINDLKEQINKLKLEKTTKTRKNTKNESHEN